MSTAQGKQYVLEQLGEGHSKIAIMQALQSGGWSSDHLTVLFADPEVEAAVAKNITTRPVVVGSSTLGDPFQLLSDAIGLVFENWLSVLYFAVLPLMTIGILSNLILDAFFDSLTALSEGEIIALMLGPQILTVLEAFMSQLLVIGFMSVVILGWARICLILSFESRDDADISKVMLHSLQLLPGYLYSSILQIGTIIGSSLIFFIPGLVMIPRLLFFDAVVILEKQFGFSALSKSREYVRGHWWGVWGRLLFIATIIMILQVAFSALFELLFGNLALADSITQPLTIFVRSLSLSLFVAYLYRMYQHLMLAKRLPEIIPPSGIQQFWYILTTALCALLIFGGVHAARMVIDELQAGFTSSGLNLAPYTAQERKQPTSF